jgi:hypothetical protein
MDTQQPVTETEPVVETERRPYLPPRIIVHGTVATVTGFLKGGSNDGKGGSDIL